MENFLCSSYGGTGRTDGTVTDGYSTAYSKKLSELGLWDNCVWTGGITGDFNDYKEPANYLCNIEDSSTNAPAVSGKIALYFIVRRFSGIIVQFIRDTSYNIIYTRKSTDSGVTWSEWRSSINPHAFSVLSVDPVLRLRKTNVADGNVTESLNALGQIRFEANDGGAEASIYASRVLDSESNAKARFLNFSAGRTTTNDQIPFMTLRAIVNAENNPWKDSHGLYSQHVYPYTNNSYNMGSDALRWRQLYVAASSIVTSDERLKANIQNIPDTVLDAWGTVDFVQYQMKDSIAKKGNAARLHTGGIAQRFKAALEAKGVDPTRYGFFCHASWIGEDWDEVIVDTPAEIGTDENGNEVIIKPEVSHTIHHHKEAGDEYSLRYEELLCIEAAYQRRRADMLEARIVALEAKLA